MAQPTGVEPASSIQLRFYSLGKSVDTTADDGHRGSRTLAFLFQTSRRVFRRAPNMPVHNAHKMAGVTGAAPAIYTVTVC